MSYTKKYTMRCMISASGQHVINSLNTSYICPGPHTDRKKESEEEEVKCVPPLNPSCPSWQHLNLKGFLCLLGTKAHRVTWSPTGTDGQREKERRGWRRIETVKVVVLGERSVRERGDKKRGMWKRDTFSPSLPSSFLSPTCCSVDAHTHGVGICGAFSVNRVST